MEENPNPLRRAALRCRYHGDADTGALLDAAAEAIEFYADMKSYEREAHFRRDGTHYFMPAPVLVDEGRKARRLLGRETEER